MILVIDNYDSFTYNLVQLLGVQLLGVQLLAAKAGREELVVLRNDAESAEAMLARKPRAIVISPGPGRPEEAGVCLEILAARPEVPILGVCLGHQALGLAFGARVDRAAFLLHGKSSNVRHLDRGLFAGLPRPFEAGRYHSLEVKEETLPPELEPMAWSDDGALMAMCHRELPWWGLQFHPESVLTPAGPALLRNFLGMIP